MIDRGPAPVLREELGKVSSWTAPSAVGKFVAKKARK